MPDYPIVDAHVHFFDPSRLRYPWLKDVPAIDKLHHPLDFRMATAGHEIETILFVEVDALPQDRFAEMSYINELRRDEPRIGGIVASALLENGAEAAVEDVEKLKAAGPLKGIRRQIQNNAEIGWCTSPGFIEGVRTLSRYGLPFDICIKSHQLAEATELVRQCPEITFVLGHIAKPSIRDGAFEPWASELKAIAALPNVVCKMTGVTTEADPRTWSRKVIHPYIDHAFSCFGMERMLFASDWPVMNLSDSFSNWVSILEDVTGPESAEAKQAFWRDNAIRAYGLAA